MGFKRPIVSDKAFGTYSDENINNFHWRFLTVVLEKTFESPLDSKGIKPVHPKGNQPWTFTGRTCAEAEAPVFWPPVVKNWLIGKGPDAGENWGQEEKGVTGWDGWVASLTTALCLAKLQEVVKHREAWCAAVLGVTKWWTLLSNWSTTNNPLLQGTVC